MPRNHQVMLPFIGDTNKNTTQYGEAKDSMTPRDEFSKRQQKEENRDFLL